MKILKKMPLILGILIMIGGILGMAYPVVGSYLNSVNHKRVIQNYTSEIKDFSDEQTEQLLKDAEAYNEKVRSRSENITSLDEAELEEYMRTLPVSDTGMIGYIDIPKIGMTIPIYHGTSEGVLQVGVGHLAGSSLPVGGKGTHTVLTGHSGLPSSKLFTDLDRLENGDRFSIMVLNRTLTYEVDLMEVVLPEEADRLHIEDDKDICTLVTCTPIGINTHRLLVTGHRVENEVAKPVVKEQVEDIEEQDDSTNKAFVVFWILIVIIGIGLIWKLRK